MTKEQCLQQLLNQMVRSVVDGNLPAMTTVAKFHTFLSQLDALETSNPAYALEALGDWVPRILQGIADSTFITITHPPVMLQSSQQSTPFMDLVVDAIATVPCQLSPSNPEPRFTVVEVFSHIIDEHGYLAYWVRWEGNDFYELEEYKNLYHLTVFMEYEDKIKPPGRARSVKSRAARDSYKQYTALRDKAVSLLTEEFDTDEDDDQVIILQPTQFPSPFEQFTSDDSMSWGDLLVAEDDDMYMPSNLDLGGSFGAEGPSHQGALFNWRELDEKLGAPGH
jgi:hypothetical protein